MDFLLLFRAVCIGAMFQKQIVPFWNFNGFQ